MAVDNGVKTFAAVIHHRLSNIIVVTLTRLMCNCTNIQYLCVVMTHFIWPFLNMVFNKKNCLLAFLYAVTAVTSVSARCLEKFDSGMASVYLKSFQLKSLKNLRGTNQNLFKT